MYFACPHFTEAFVYSAAKKYLSRDTNKKPLSTECKLVACEEVGFVGGEVFKRTGRQATFTKSNDVCPGGKCVNLFCHVSS